MGCLTFLFIQVRCRRRRREETCDRRVYYILETLSRKYSEFVFLFSLVRECAVTFSRFVVVGDDGQIVRRKHQSTKMDGLVPSQDSGWVGRVGPRKLVPGRALVRGTLI